MANSGRAVWTNYSTREAADMVGLTESVVRSCVRSGVLALERECVPLRFSFQDLVVLRIVKALVKDGLSVRRARRELGLLARRSPDIALSSLSISARGGHVVVRDERCAWRAESGQLVFEFELEPPPGGEAAMAAMPVRREAPGPEPTASLTAEQWFERALSLEESDPAQAIEAYARAIHLRPDCGESQINQGRLYAETGRPQLAAACFQRALQLDPRDATALYNLGVVAQDAGRDLEAVELYKRALAVDSNLAEAHYNLATIFDRSGDPQRAIRHINAYRKLTR